MTTRIRDENIIHAPGRKQLKKGNENNLSITRPTLASSAKAKPGMLPPYVGNELITELKSKGSRTVLAPLSKSNPNATPRPKDTTEKPKPLTNKISIKSNPLQTPKPVKKVVPKSTKKTINVYTPARPKEENEVEHSHPKPPGLEDGPPTPIRNAMFAAADLVDDDIPPPSEEPVWEDDFGLHLDNPVSPTRPLP